MHQCTEKGSPHVTFMVHTRLGGAVLCFAFWHACAYITIPHPLIHTACVVAPVSSPTWMQSSASLPMPWMKKSHGVLASSCHMIDDSLYATSVNCDVEVAMCVMCSSRSV